jgi:hypothetical protein
MEQQFGRNKRKFEEEEIHSKKLKKNSFKIKESQEFLSELDLEIEDLEKVSFNNLDKLENEKTRM